MATWRAAEALKLLYSQIRLANPEAVKHTPLSSWGFIADNLHSSTSDHSPKNFPGWGNRIVTATDFPHAPDHGLDAGEILENIRKSRDSRVKYAIFNRRMFSSYAVPGHPAFTWRPYHGKDPHDTHGHLSVVGDSRADNRRVWQIGKLADSIPLPAPLPEPPKIGDDMIVHGTIPGGAVSWLIPLALTGGISFKHAWVSFGSDFDGEIRAAVHQPGDFWEVKSVLLKASATLDSGAENDPATLFIPEGRSKLIVSSLDQVAALPGSIGYLVKYE